jgi:hypothetical protein
VKAMYYKGHYFSNNQIEEMNHILNTSMLRRIFLNGTKNYIIYDQATGEKVVKMKARPGQLKKVVKLWRIEENKRIKELNKEGYNYNLIPEDLIAKLEYPITYESDYMLSKTRYYEQTIKATDNTTYTEPPRINYFED